MINRLAAIGQSIWYWLGLLLFGIAQEGVALYYQYALDEWPCVLCIHVRILVMALILLALLTLLIKGKLVKNIAHALSALISLWLLERSWELLGVERGFKIGSCSMESGFPNWFVVDKWFPLIFEIQAPCGYTPPLLFGITMAEALFVLYAALVIISSALAVCGFMSRKVEALD